MLLLLADGSHLPVSELPGRGPWTFLVLQPEFLDPPATDQAVPAREAARGGVAWVRAHGPAWEEPELAEAMEEVLGRLGGGPGWPGIAPDAPPR